MTKPELIQAVRDQALKWEPKLKGWNHIKFMSDEDLSRLIKPKVSTPTGAVNSVYELYIKSGAHLMYEPKANGG